MTAGKEKKMEYMMRLVSLLEEYDRCILVSVDNIASSHMQGIRKSLRGKAIILLGKNTLMRKAIKLKLDEHPEWECLLPRIKGNVGMVFTKDELLVIKPLLLESRVPAAAKAGIIAPQDVILEKQVTNLEPTKTSFFASLDIATKITRGSVEILNTIHLCKVGEKVGPSEAALLQLLDIRPFTYGLILTHIYDSGFCYEASLLDITPDDLFRSFAEAVSRVAAFSLGLGYPTLAAFPHIVLGAYKKMVAICLETDYVFEQAKALKERVENPDAFAVAAPAATESKAVEAAPVEEEEESSELDMGMDYLFGF
jgi:large subunit ribosomal protein LP0